MRRTVLVPFEIEVVEKLKTAAQGGGRGVSVTDAHRTTGEIDSARSNEL
jgi:hypothetical protein